MYLFQFPVHSSEISSRYNFFSPLIASADSCSFFFLSISLSFRHFSIYIFIHLIYQVKGISGISGYVWDVCGCVRVCAGVPRWCAQVCTGVRRCAQVCTGVCGYAWVFSGWLRVWKRVHECVQVCTGVRVIVRGCA